MWSSGVRARTRFAWSRFCSRLSRCFCFFRASRDMGVSSVTVWDRLVRSEASRADSVRARAPVLPRQAVNNHRLHARSGAAGCRPKGSQPVAGLSTAWAPGGARGRPRPGRSDSTSHSAGALRRKLEITRSERSVRLMAYEIEFSPDAIEHLTTFRKFEQRRITDSIERQLRLEPLKDSRHRKPMRSNLLATRELRVGAFRAYYDVDQGERRVLI